MKAVMFEKFQEAPRLVTAKDPAPQPDGVVLKVAATLEGMRFSSYNGDVELRKADHQMQQGRYITRWEKASAKYPYSPENTGYTLAPVKFYDAYVASTPTSCQMKRPTK